MYYNDSNEADCDVCFDMEGNFLPKRGTDETVVLLSKGEIDSKNIRVEFSLEDMNMSEFQDGATYPQIKRDRR